MKYIYLLCLTGMMCYACTGQQKEQENQEFSVSGDTIVVSSESPIAKKLKTSEVQKELHETTFTVSGIVKAIPNHYAEIASPFAGRVTRSFIRLGQKVDKGSPLFEISSPDFFETGKVYYQAKQEMELASKNLRREQDLYAHKVSAQKEVEEAEVNYELKKKDYENAKKTSKLNRLYSSVNGEVIAKNLAPGDFVTGGVSVITIADMDKTQIRTEYIGSSVLDRASGYQALINGKKYKVTAQEQDVSQMDVEMGNLPTSTYFGYEKDANVSVGDSVTLEFYNNATEDALVVPSNAVFKAKSEHYVYRMDGDAKKKVKVTLGTKTDVYTQIMSGLKEGDVVYVQD